MTRNLMISRWNWLTDAVLSGGDWDLNAPLDNIKDPNPQLVAQAVDNNPSNSQFIAHIGGPRWVDCLYVAHLRTSSVALVKATLALDAGFSTGITSTLWKSSWPQDKLPGGPSPWGQVSPGGRYEPDEMALLGWPRCFMFDHVLAEYVRFEIDDSLSTEPPQVGTVVVAQCAEYPENMLWDWRIVSKDESTGSRAAYGSFYPTRRNRRRRLEMGLELQPDGRRGGLDDVFGRQFGMALVQGLTEPLLVIPQPDDVMRLEKTALYATSASDRDFRNTFYGDWATAMTFEQWI